MKKKRGATVVEVAVIMPLLLVIMLGTVEYGWYFFTAQTIKYAAREGARVGSLAISTDDDIKNKIKQSMVGIPYSEPIIIEDTSECILTVTVVSPYSDISLTGGYLGTIDNIVGEATTHIEGCVAE